MIGLFTGTVEVPVLSGSPTSTDLQEQVADLTASKRSLEAQNEALVEKIDELSAKQAESETSAGSDSTAAPDGEITINNYTCIDLDSEEADWGAIDYGDGGDLCYSDYLRGDRLSVLDDEPTYDICSSQTQFDESIREVATLLDRYVCVTSDADRLVSVHVTAASSRAMSFEITKLES
ncbi:hypothetical protein GCM10017772_34170 [Promicromonospora soli]|uniref:Uncharacterized protein n=1 Tax=Promicromonospora soli TaxID=2035533 RepID=A0A919G223_9MICO|nr:hypothetical protein GCM10017772_34170 [Promicromonospora soli]